MTKYNVGDKVKIISTRGIGWNEDGEMDKYCGETLTINRILSGRYYQMQECPGWVFDDSDIVGLVE